MKHPHNRPFQEIVKQQFLREVPDKRNPAC